MENDNIDAELLRDLEESAYPIVEQNKALLTRLKCRGFNPAKELDFTANNAGVLIHKFFESVAQFDEGKVPCAALEELFFTTDSLIDELKKCDNVPVCELDAAGVAFREAGMLWKDNHPKPLMERAVYLKKHFDGEKDIKKALKTLHAAYVKKFAAKGKKTKTLSAADVNKEDNKENENRLRIYQEIDRLRKNGYSVLKAIENMQNGSYGGRMRGVSAATWKRYYFERSRRNRLADAAKRKTTPTSKIIDPTCKAVYPTCNKQITPTSKVIDPTCKVIIPTCNKQIDPTCKEFDPTCNKLITPTSNEKSLTRMIIKILKVIDGEITRAEIMDALGVKDRATFVKCYLSPALKYEFIEMTQPNSPRSPTQRYRLSEKGREWRRNEVLLKWHE